MYINIEELVQQNNVQKVVYIHKYRGASTTEYFTSLCTKLIEEYTKERETE